MNRYSNQLAVIEIMWLKFEIDQSVWGGEIEKSNWLIEHTNQQSTVENDGLELSIKGLEIESTDLTLNQQIWHWIIDFTIKIFDWKIAIFDLMY